MVLLAPYWSFFAASGGDLASDRAALNCQLADALDAVVDVTVVAAVTGDDPLAPLVDDVRAADPDAVVVASTMAAPPGPFLRLLDLLGDLPLLLWAARRTGRLSDPYDHAAITRDGATVGVPQLTSLLTRQGRPFGLVVGALDDAEAMTGVLAGAVAAAAAGRVRRARIGRVGRPLDGYDCVDADHDRLSAALGAEVVQLTAGQFSDCYEAVDDAWTEALLAETAAAYRLRPEALDQHRRSVRAAAALVALVDEHRLDAGAFNCHVPEIRLGEDIGFAPCFALGHCTSQGVPWTCTGDVLTAVAMLTTKALTGAALYHELESCDQRTGEFVVANSGEHDLAVGHLPADVGRNPWWTGTCAVTSPRQGPATLVAFAQLRTTHRFVAAAGTVTGRRFPDTGTSNGAFRFDASPAASAWTAWCRAGANHHSALTPHAITEQVMQVAAHLGQEAVVV